MSAALSDRPEPDVLVGVRSVTARQSAPVRRSRLRSLIDRHGHELLALACGAVVLDVAGTATNRTSIGAGLGIALIAGAMVLGTIALRVPWLCVVLVLLASFLRIVPQLLALPIQPFTVTFATMTVAIVLAVGLGSARMPRFGWVEILMCAFLLWNVVSAITPHELDPISSQSNTAINLRSFIQTGVLIPFALYFAGRFLATRRNAVRAVLWSAVWFGAYSTLVSILQFTGPTGLVWPRYIIDSPAWVGRAVGVFNQPVVDGLVIDIGVVVGLHLAGQPGMAIWKRIGLYLLVGPSMVAIYLTHTRVAWLAFILVLVGGIIISPRLRRPMSVILLTVIGYVLLNWDTVFSSDRDAGGIGSASEVEDRLNIMATSLWGIAQKPFTGWGIGRFQQLNTFYHQQWSPDIDWVRGLGLASHENELGIGAELGLPALAVWVAVFVLIAILLVKAILPARTPDRAVRELGAVAVLALVVWIVTGTTVDLRFVEFGGALVMLLAGIAVETAHLSRTAVDPSGERVA